ncbi:unnamed protein product [Toxocara canis]|uniref:Clathrin light chain n=1 Tax=Toxocara canis TaxID=6265 RepID=A0A183URR4_TOXCA|nr:unnamed protein product [Toxocara canis]
MTTRKEDSDTDSKSDSDSSESSSVCSQQAKELAEDDVVQQQIQKLLDRREERNNEARIRFLQWQREQKEAQEEAKQFEAYWKRRHEEDRDLWRDKDFANAVDKMSRAGYKGEHGNFEVPEEIIQQLNALYMQITVGEYG